MDREAWRPTVHGAAKSWTRLSKQTTTKSEIRAYFTRMAPFSWDWPHSMPSSLGHLEALVLDSAAPGTELLRAEGVGGGKGSRYTK